MLQPFIQTKEKRNFIPNTGNMQFEPNNIYHIYNRGNNSQRIFFTRDNYLFFLKKLQTYITPFADILAWCLMPNHFHLMVYVNRISKSEQVSRSQEHSLADSKSEQVSDSHQLTSHGSSEQVSRSHQLSGERSINDSISILLRSYTRALNHYALKIHRFKKSNEIRWNKKIEVNYEYRLTILD
jgi:putative transposase